MVPPVLIHNNQGVLNFLALAVAWLKILKRKKINEEFSQMLTFMLNQMHMCILWVQLLQLINRYMKLRSKKKRLMKPHLLLQFLGGYRLESHNVMCN